MDAVITSIDRAVRSIAPVDALIGLAAKRLLPQAEAAACPSIYCGRFCEFHSAWGGLRGNYSLLPDRLVFVRLVALLARLRHHRDVL